jgi:hypothetical protein
MSTALSDQDARAVAEALKKLWALDGSPEKRRGERKPCQAVQLVAPYVRSKLPEKRMFTRVLCDDISVGGFSFSWPNEPGFQYVVAGLGNLDDPTYMTARVVHYSRHADPGKGYLVGCRFLGRVIIA